MQWQLTLLLFTFHLVAVVTCLIRLRVFVTIMISAICFIISKRCLIVIRIFNFNALLYSVYDGYKLSPVLTNYDLCVYLPIHAIFVEENNCLKNTNRKFTVAWTIHIWQFICNMLHWHEHAFSCYLTFSRY